MEKTDKMIDDINKKFGVNIRIIKLGGRWSVKPEKINIEPKKLKDIREYVLLHSQELEEADDI